ncbi:MAG: hypothetical protein WA484_10290 [Solirubrobacteraceae bacterium]
MLRAEPGKRADSPSPGERATAKQQSEAEAATHASAAASTLTPQDATEDAVAASTAAIATTNDRRHNTTTPAATTAHCGEPISRRDTSRLRLREPLHGSQFQRCRLLHVRSRLRGCCLRAVGPGGTPGCSGLRSTSSLGDHRCPLRLTRDRSLLNPDLTERTIHLLAHASDSGTEPSYGGYQLTIIGCPHSPQTLPDLGRVAVEHRLHRRHAEGDTTLSGR